MQCQAVSVSLTSAVSISNWASNFDLYCLQSVFYLVGCYEAALHKTNRHCRIAVTSSIGQ